MTALLPIRKRATVIGHSQDAKNGQWCRSSKMWPHRMEASFQGLGIGIKFGNYSASGNTIGTAAAAIHGCFRYGIPDLASINVGVNDVLSVVHTTTGTGSVNDVQTLNYPGFGVSGPSFVVEFFTGGTWRSSAAIPKGTTAAALQTALEAISGIGSGNVAVSGTTGAGPFTITFQGALTHAAQTTMRARDTSITRYIQAMIKVFKFGAYGPWQRVGTSGGREPIGPAIVADQTALPTKGKYGQRHVVLTDTSTNGGCTPDPWSLAKGLCVANVTGAGGSAVAVWEYRNDRAGEPGWGRVQIGNSQPATHCTRLMVDSVNYQNNGGDTPATPLFYNVPVNTDIIAAVATEAYSVDGVPQVILTDLYGYQRRLIVGGAAYGGSDVTWPPLAVPNFSSDSSIVATTSYDQTKSWLTSSTTQHENEYGQLLRMLAKLDGGPNGTAIPAQWLTDLAA